MSWLNPAALVLLAAVPVLLWLALRRRRPRAIQFGTLFIWRRVAAAASTATRSKRRLEPLLWMLLAACAQASLGAARPAFAPASAHDVAVFIERLAPSGPEPELDGVLDRAREIAPGAALRVWFAGEPGELGAANTLNPGPVSAELAQFVAASRDMPRLMFLCEAEGGAAGVGLVVPRVTAPREGVIFEVGSENDLLFVRMTQGASPSVEGASLREIETRGREYTRKFEVTGETVHISNAGQSLTLQRTPLAVGTGDDWAGARHKALLAALKPGAGEPVVWLGGAAQAPAVRINQGAPADLAGLEINFDSQHALFRELPLASLTLAGGRLTERAPGVRPLASAMRGGEVAGDLVTLSADGKVLHFAGDPFSDSSVTAAALLLDNAVGVVAGTRPSQWQPFQLVEGLLPARRQAMAEPFEPRGEIGSSLRPAQPHEFAPWLLALAALCALGAAALALRRRM